MKRKEDWESRLAAFIHRHYSMPFKWGQNDCCLFACDWVIEATVAEYDLGVGFRGKYKTRDGALKQLIKHGCETVEDLALKMECTMFPQQPLRMTMRGDLVTGDANGTHGALIGIAIGVCVGAQVAFTGKDGITYIDLLDCRKSWKI